MPTFPDRLLLIGCGNMAGAMLCCWLACGLDPARVSVVRPSGREVAPGVAVMGDLPDRIAPGTLVMLGFKPQQLAAIAPTLAPLWRADLTLISLLAGVPVATLRATIAPAGPLVRVMPNTPVALGKGVCALHADVATGAQARAAVEALMAPLGLVEWIAREDGFNLVTALTGCGPAFVFRFIDAMARAAAMLGMDDAQAARLALATVEGAAALAVSAGEAPAQLADRVASSGGMTRAGLDVMDSDGRLVALLADVLRAARDRGEALAQAAEQGPPATSA